MGDAPTFEQTASPTSMPTNLPTALQLLNKLKSQPKNQQGNKCAVLGAVFAKIKTRSHGVIEARKIAKVPVMVNTLILMHLSLKDVVHGMENASLETLIATVDVKIV